MNKSKRNFFITAMLFLAFIIFTVFVKMVDVAPVGPNMSQIGFSSVNTFFFEFLGQSKLWYDITDVFGIVAILSAGIFAFIGFCQLIKRKNLFKIDKELFALAGFYVVVGICYVIFEVIVINYRPVLMDGVLEASYPSSHTMLVASFLSAAIIMIKKYVKNTTLANALKIICGIIILITVVGRLLSGVHWFTDIFGGALLSSALTMLLYSVITKIEE